MDWDTSDKAAKEAAGNPRSARAGVARQSDPGTLQDRLGNQGVLRLLRARPAVQAKLAVSRPGDAHEAEADRAADAVMREGAAPSVTVTPWSPGVQRACSSCAEEEEKKSPLQRMAVQRRAHPAGDDEEELMQAKSDGAPSGKVEASLSSHHGGGDPLPAPARSFFQSRFGRDFGGVRVHTGPGAADLSRQLHAHAFTRGDDIFFAPGRFDPTSNKGRHLLAHELAHTVQQRGETARLERRADDDHKNSDE